MGKWCLHASSFIFDRIIIKVAGNQDRHKSSDEFDFGPLVSLVHLYASWPWYIGLRWAIVALWATCLISVKLNINETFYCFCFFSLTDSFYAAWNCCIGRDIQLRRKIGNAILKAFLGIAQPRAKMHLQYLSWADSVKLSLLFSNFWCCTSKRTSFHIFQRSQQLSLCCVAAIKRIPIHWYGVVMFTFYGRLGLWGSMLSWNQSIIQIMARKGEGCCIFQDLMNMLNQTKSGAQ